MPCLVLDWPTKKGLKVPSQFNNIATAALFGGLADEERAQIDIPEDFKVAKRRPENKRKQALKAKEKSSDDGETVARKRQR